MVELDLQVVNNPVKAAKLTEQADDLEDAMSKEGVDSSINITLFSVVGSLFRCKYIMIL